MKLLKQKIKTLTDSQLNLQCTKIKEKKIDLINTFCFPSRPPKVKSTTLLQKSGAGSLRIHCPKCWNLCDCTTNKILQKPGKLCLLFPDKYCLCIFYRVPRVYPILSHTCVYTQTGTHTDLENLLNFINELQKASGNTLQDKIELCQI